MSDWQESARCSGEDWRIFFPNDVQSRTDYSAAKAICRQCDVTKECLAFALSFERQSRRDGVWGGTTPRERDKRRAIIACCEVCGEKFTPRPWQRQHDGCRAVARQATVARYQHRSRVA